jgi:hypothetical protein
MKLGLLAATLVLVAGGAVGCGSDDGSGGKAGSGGGGGDDSASTDDFCAAFQAFSDDLDDVTGTEANLGEILKKAAQRIEDVGTPKGIPADAKAGLQLTLDAIMALPDDASVEDMGGLEDDFSADDQKKTDAFTDYLAKTCPELGDSGGSESDSGGDSSDAPTDDSSGDGS